MIIGIDFDNTIVDYEALFSTLSVEAELFDHPPPGTKREIRDLLRRRPGGEEAWQELQALAYGSRILEASVATGFESFLDACRERGARVMVVSHKTSTAARAPDGPELPAAARRWISTHLDPAAVAWDECTYFEPTRAAKIARIAELGCTHFIDDLLEVFLDPSFPDATERWLYAPGGSATDAPGVRVFEGWAEIERALRGDVDA